MSLIEAEKDDLERIKNWNDSVTIEFQTCRPVLNGFPVTRINNVFNFLFYTEHSDIPMGNIFYFDVNERNRSCEFGYKINPDFRNQGYGKEMLKEFISYMFTKKNFNKLYCQTASFNIPSVKMLQRLGFNLDGILREHHELGGKFYDDYVYSVLKSEWN